MHGSTEADDENGDDVDPVATANMTLDPERQILHTSGWQIDMDGWYIKYTGLALVPTVEAYIKEHSLRAFACPNGRLVVGDVEDCFSIDKILK